MSPGSSVSSAAEAGSPADGSETPGRGRAHFQEQLAQLETVTPDNLRAFTALETEFHLKMAEEVNLDRARDLIRAVRLREEFVRIDSKVILDPTAMADIIA